mmetsp:Transcript_4629/g.4346  ORF Transcript_4629/g.4346 Transcript_4629/m.4346 type:complete len:216 (+) Transcript_4629:567-1214(+)
MKSSLGFLWPWTSWSFWSSEYSKLGTSLEMRRRMLKMTRSDFSLSFWPWIWPWHSRSFLRKYSLSWWCLPKKSQVVRPFFFARSCSCTFSVFSSRLVSAVNDISAEFLMDQLSELNASIARIIDSVTNFLMSCFNKESWKMYRMMLSECTLMSSFSAVEAWCRRKERVWFSRTGSFWAGSARKIAKIVGGIPADLRRMVLTFSTLMLSRAFWSSF